MMHHLRIQEQELSAAVSELERRDSVGAPEARNLIESQRETLQAQARAMEEAQRLIDAQKQMLAQFEERTDDVNERWNEMIYTCLLYTSPSPRDQRGSRMPSSA